jgi:hypothetical protein
MIDTATEQQKSDELNVQEISMEMDNDEGDDDDDNGSRDDGEFHDALDFFSKSLIPSGWEE